MDIFNRDIIYETITHLEYRDILNFCESDDRINNLCRNDPQISQLILDRYVDNFIESFSDINQAFFDAIKFNKLDIVDNLILRGVDPSIENNVAIKWASEKGHFDIVDRLLRDERVDPSDQNNFAIITASHKGHLNVINRLLENPRVDPADQNNYAIMLASKEGHLDIVDRLLQYSRVDPSDQNNEAIRFANINHHQNVVNRLLEDPRVSITVEI